MIIDHIGIVVRSIEDGIIKWKKLFDYDQMTEIVLNSKQNVKVVFLKKDGSTLIKLVEAINENSPVFEYSKKGGGLHHICFKCENLDLEIEKLKELGIRITAEPQIGEAFGNNRISFVYARDGINIELIDTDFKAHILNSQ
jgi:methylmalonyl-CoA/ethylmalonyl-CoA epimerase